MDISVYLVTYNCGRLQVDVDRFAPLFFSHRSPTLPPPDLIVLCLQEIAPYAHSFLGGSLLAPYFRRLHHAINQATNEDYQNLATRNVGMTAIMILARPDVAPYVRPQSYAGVGVGQWQMGNKGAVGVRLAAGKGAQAQLTFVSAHLAPMEDAWLRRNQDWKNIVAGLIFSRHPQDSSNAAGSERQPLLAAATRDTTGSLQETSMFQAHVPLFFAGDLNYRTADTGPTINGYEDFPQPSQSDDAAFQSWREGDQLSRERLSDSTLQYLDELPIRFPPTYKYEPDERMQWPKDGSEPSTYKWAKHRYPSWCDRILFSSQLNQAGSPFEAVNYVALPLQPTSDHRPVALSFKLHLDSFISGTDAIREQELFVSKNVHWAADRASARRLEIVFGSFAYLTSTNEGNLLLLASFVGAIGGWLVLRSMIQP